MAIALSVERQDTSPEDCLERTRKGAAKKNLNNKGVLKKEDWKPQDKAAGEKKE